MEQTGVILFDNMNNKDILIPFYAIRHLPSAFKVEDPLKRAVDVSIIAVTSASTAQIYSGVINILYDLFTK